MVSVSPAESPGSKKRTISESNCPSPELSPLTEPTSLADDNDVSECNLLEGLAQQKELAPTTTVNDERLKVSVSSVKRRKLTAEEKAHKVKQREIKEADKKAKGEEKRQRQLEKQRKDEERKQEKLKRAEDREKRNRIKEEEKTKKVEERERKEEEKRKKDKAQMRLNTFFGPPDSPRTLPIGKTVSLLEETLLKGMRNTGKRKTPPRSSRRKTAQTDFERAFAPFFIQSHVFMAPTNTLRDIPLTQAVCDAIDEQMKGSAADTPSERSQALVDIKGFWQSTRTKLGRERIKPIPRVRDLLMQLQGQVENPIDLTDRPDVDMADNPVTLLDGVPVKHLFYAEDVRPAYNGTFTRHPPEDEARRLARNPFQRKLPDTDYDYDSEAEWEEPDPEAEDVESNGEEDVDDGDGDDAEMEGFLDDEGCEVKIADARYKRPVISGDLEPISTGLCWEDAEGHCHKPQKTTGASKIDLEHFRMEIIGEHLQMPITPFPDSSAAPASPAISSGSKNKIPTSKTKGGTNDMKPPRVPLHALKKANGVGSPRLINPDDMADFKAAVEGSDLTKLGLIEVLKKRFPYTHKDVIRDTLTAVAIRVGDKQVNKRWKLKDAM